MEIVGVDRPDRNSVDDDVVSLPSPQAWPVGWVLNPEMRFILDDRYKKNGMERTYF